jgi:twitching motility protein PilT
VGAAARTIAIWKKLPMLDSLMKLAQTKWASDLHLEPELPPVLRIDGELRTLGEPISAKTLLDLGRKIIGDAGWPLFLERGSYDLAATICHVRCRINIFRTLRGIGMALRLLSSFQPTLTKLNLHPDLLEILRHPHGLVLVSGPTGSGKSSTMAALIQEINLEKAKHIITIENPIEYHFALKRAFIRQREVGRDTPTFSQGLMDALREDPDVLMVGEMREPEVMRHTLNAAETGHLVLTTVHSGTVIEALQRIVAAFPAEFQYGVRAQLADSLLAVICQRLIFKPEENIRVPECEVLFANMTVKSVIREGKFFKLNDILQTSASEKMWSFERYRKWLDSRSDWYRKALTEHERPAEIPKNFKQADLDQIVTPMPLKPAIQKSTPSQPPSKKKRTSTSPLIEAAISDKSDYYEIGDGGHENMEDILKQLNTLKKRGKKDAF